MTFSGEGAYDELSGWLNSKEIRSALIVSGDRSYASVSTRLEPVVRHLDLDRIDSFSPNPKQAELAGILRDWEPAAYGLIIAVGGGTAIDIAKLLKFYGANRVIGLNGGGELSPPLDIPIVAIPTTSGSGSEATHFAVLYDGNKKTSIAHATLKPEVSLLDPSSLIDLPYAVLASSLLDALCQSIESYWSIHSTGDSRALALESMQILMSILPEASRTRTPMELGQFMRASNLAGQAINITKTTAPHAVSYPLTSGFGISHGFAVASVMPEFLVYNSQIDGNELLDKRGGEFVKARMAEIFATFGVHSAKEAKEKFVALLKSMDAVSSLSGAGVGRSDFDTLLQDGFNPDRVNNNPRLLTKQALAFILENALAR